MSDNISRDELLCYLVDNGKIDLDGVRNEMNRKKREKLLKRHSYEIWQNTTDKRWYSYLPDETKRNGRKQIKKTYLMDLEDAIIAYYENDKAWSDMRLLTMRELYPRWLEYKALHTDATSYVKRIDDDWRKYYLSDKIIDVQIADFDFITLDTWAHKIVKKYNLTKKQYYNITVIIRQMLDFAVELSVIDSNLFRKVKVRSKIMKKVRKPNSNTQVFQMDELRDIEEEALKDYEQNHVTVALAVLLAFQIGVRLGELVAIKTTDITGDYLHIQRMEQKEYCQDESGAWKAPVVKIVDHVKSIAGDREVFLTERAKEYLAMIQETNALNGYYDDDYLFISENGRVTSRAIDYRIRKYCDKINIMRKSVHKIRKTYISTLIDGGVNINRIRELVGHENEKTTYQSYCFDRQPVESENRINQLLSQKE